VNGLAVRQGLADVVDLVNIFNAIKGPVQKVYLVGASEGGLITTLGVERHPDVFSGGLAVCGPIGSFPLQVNYIGDFRVVFAKALYSGSFRRLLAIPVDRYGHCNFTSDEVLTAFGALVVKAEGGGLSGVSSAVEGPE